jgi:hypothetical protein
MGSASALKRIGKALLVDYILDSIKALARLLRLKARFGVAISLSLRPGPRSDTPIDIVIPVIDKDAGTLPHVIDSARECILHPIANIYLVAPSGSQRIRRIAEEKSCVFIDEAPLLPIGKKDIDYRVGGVDRSGWLLQQLLKWCGDRFATQDNYLVLDSDTVLVRPQAFISGGKTIFDFCDEYHEPYFDGVERLLKFRPSCTVSFTSHHALINRAAMEELKREIERIHGTQWYRGIIGILDRSNPSSISDYEEYGQFFFRNHRSQMAVRYWYNKSLPRSRIEFLGLEKARYAKRYRTLSFHDYKD